ncbi:MAG TPA: hypothetical protein VG938_19175 [Verrucomicrobiae bacterium]|jgi:hypothetical protein|nr:hypothetical protein [Verrucomicrobiae bacterium]
MQISRHLLLACAVATCLSPILLRAYDNAAQIRARQALEDKMKQLDVPASQTTSAPPAVVKKPAPAQKPKKVITPEPAHPAAPPAPPVVKSAPAYENPPAQSAPVFAPEIPQAATPSHSAADQKLREALHEKITETPAVVPAPEPAAPVATTPAPRVTAPTPAPVAPAAPVYSPAPKMTPAAPSSESEPAPVYSSTPTPAPASPENQKLNEALNKNLQQNEASSVQSGKSANREIARKENSGMKPAPEPTMSLPQLNGPASPLTPAKQQKLDALLQLYRADQLTPEQYHDQRAKILSEP